jgi:hypothetical protein
MERDRNANRGGGELPNQEVELLTTELRIENKRFYFNLKENQKGRFLKIAEVSGGRSTIIIPQSGWNEFRNMLDDFIAGKA